ncbi:hypothetical protein [Adlercreutzia sp. ZJ473]|uniref:hypothetical protein n=1 Tax=Adlercreutzia sp. ZJ473 TaxID=2722822 RepID=UPI001555BB8B|nr:hypothetical protein [Adlercreutzia sp. ZJ473]
MAKRETVDVIVGAEAINEIGYTNKQGEPDSFFKVALPPGSAIAGEDVSGWEFSPKFVNPVKGDPRLCSLPLLADRLVWLTKAELDEEGHVIRDDAGKAIRRRKDVDPREIKRIFDEHGPDEAYEEDIAF